MTQDEIIEMTRKAGWSGIYIVWAEPTGEADWSPYKVSLTVPVTMEQIEAFAKQVEDKALAQRSESSGKPSAWVGLTNDELTDLFHNTNLGQASSVAQAIALLKEKNT